MNPVDALLDELDAMDLAAWEDEAREQHAVEDADYSALCAEYGL